MSSRLSQILRTVSQILWVTLGFALRSENYSSVMNPFSEWIDLPLAIDIPLDQGTQISDLNCSKNEPLYNLLFENLCFWINSNPTDLNLNIPSCFIKLFFLKLQYFCKNRYINSYFFFLQFYSQKRKLYYFLKKSLHQMADLNQGTKRSHDETTNESIQVQNEAHPPKKRSKSSTPSQSNPGITFNEDEQQTELESNTNDVVNLVDTPNDRSQLFLHILKMI